MKKALIFFVTLIALVVATMALAMPPPQAGTNTAGDMAIMVETQAATPAPATIITLGATRYGEPEAQPAALPAARRLPLPETARNSLVASHLGTRPTRAVTAGMVAVKNAARTYASWHEDGALASQR